MARWSRCKSTNILLNSLYTKAMFPSFPRFFPQAAMVNVLLTHMNSPILCFNSSLHVLFANRSFLGAGKMLFVIPCVWSVSLSNWYNALYPFVLMPTSSHTFWTSSLLIILVTSYRISFVKSTRNFFHFGSRMTETISGLFIHALNIFP